MRDLKIFKEGLKSNYLDYQENTNFLKGKLMISDHIKQNMFNKTRFNCKFNIYSVDITENRIIKRTLLKLKKVSRSHKNLSLINSLLVHFDQVKSSTNIQKDLDLINNNNRLFSNYNRILSWSKVFLTDSSFTNFSGDNRNLAILFPMEKIFEDYIGYLFKKYSNGIQIKLQDQSYFLVENHKGTSKFRLKPDIVTSSSEDSKIVIDTKWKLINQFAERSNYFIKQPDMYQLYAYGKKYTDETSPLLILLYPKNENFTTYDRTI
jgi:5-methylcytosine-specific restriction enzyme subunit McrC